LERTAGLEGREARTKKGTWEGNRAKLEEKCRRRPTVVHGGGQKGGDNREKQLAHGGRERANVGVNSVGRVQRRCRRDKLQVARGKRTSKVSIGGTTMGNIICGGKGRVSREVPLQRTKRDKTKRKGKEDGKRRKQSGVGLLGERLSEL